MEDLTKEQQKILVSMYKQFLSKQPALSPEDANYFGNSDDMRDQYLPTTSSDYVSDLFWSLYRKGYVYCTKGEDLANEISLTDKTIVYMENRFKNGFKEIAEFLANFLPF
ncbi:MAG: hypothetical protein HFI88_10045 [Lachnospiraceae bacterium]|nr:hypothetical protein [Lachnospiraceae bacterium]